VEARKDVEDIDAAANQVCNAQPAEILHLSGVVEADRQGHDESGVGHVCDCCDGRPAAQEKWFR
jgi:hypothetical protein